MRAIYLIASACLLNLLTAVAFDVTRTITGALARLSFASTIKDESVAVAPQTLFAVLCDVPEGRTYCYDGAIIRRSKLHRSLSRIEQSSVLAHTHTRTRFNFTHYTLDSQEMCRLCAKVNTHRGNYAPRWMHGRQPNRILAYVSRKLHRLRCKNETSCANVCFVVVLSLL